MLHRYVVCQIRMWHGSITCQNEMAHGLVVCQIKIHQGCIVTDCLFKSLPGLTANKPPKLCTRSIIAESVSMPLLTLCVENHGQSVVCSHTRPNIAESVSMPLLTLCVENHGQSVVCSHTRPNIAESVPMPLFTHFSEKPLAVCGLLAHRAQYCRKCIHAFTDPLCWESTGSLWFTRTQGPILQKVYPCLYWPSVPRIHWQSVVYSHTRPNIAESVSMSLLTHCAENPLAVCG